MPKQLNAEELQNLEKVAEQVVNLLELRRSQLELNHKNEQLERKIETLSWENCAKVAQRT